MRVALITPNGNARDAALFIALARANPELMVIVPRQDMHGVWPSDVDVMPLDARGSNWTRQWMRGLGSAIEAYDPDLVHVHNEPWAVTAQRLVHDRRPVVIHAAENILATAPVSYRIRRAGVKWSLNQAAGYVNWGHTGLHAALSFGLPTSTPRAVIPASPPDTTVFAEVPLALPSERLRLTYVGRLVAEKGVGTILQAMATPRRRGALTLTIVGEGPLEGDLRAHAARLGVNARFAGPLDAAGTHAAIASADVLVVPSIDTAVWSEQWGRVVVEAMMTGRSVLASDAGELPHLVANSDWVFHQNDPESLGRALDLLLSDPRLVRTRAEEALVRAQMFAPIVLAEQMLTFWGEVLGQWRARHPGTGCT